jgi:hypothetical protein
MVAIFIVILTFNTMVITIVKVFSCQTTIMASVMGVFGSISCNRPRTSPHVVTGKCAKSISKVATELSIRVIFGLVL